MALKRFIEGIGIDQYAQVELNNVAFRRDGRIEAQCALDGEEFKTTPAENGMILAVDKANRVIKFAEDDSLPVALHYSSEHMYDERKPGLANFSLRPGTFFPRMGYLSVGDLWTSNCLCYEDSEFTDDTALKNALKGCATTTYYGGISEIGAVKISATKPSVGPVLKVVKFYTMPNGAPGVKFQVIKA